MQISLSVMRPDEYAGSFESTEAALMSGDIRSSPATETQNQRDPTDRNKILRLLMPLGSILCMIVASILGVRSEWYKDTLSHKGHRVCTVIGILYFCMVLVVFLAVFVLVYLSECPQTSTVNWKVKFVIHIAVLAMLYLSTNVFEKAPADTDLLFGLFFAASHIHLAAEFLHIHENYGLTEGVMLAALIVAYHLSKIWPLKGLVLVCGGAIIVLYLRRKIFCQNTLPQEPSIVEGNTSEPSIVEGNTSEEPSIVEGNTSNIYPSAVERRSSSGNQSHEPCKMQRSSSQFITIRRPFTVDRSYSFDNAASYQITIMSPMEPLPPLPTDRIEANITAESKAKGKAVDENESSVSASVVNIFVQTVLETGVSGGTEESRADNEKIWDQKKETWGLMDHEAKSSDSDSASVAKPMAKSSVKASVAIPRAKSSVKASVVKSIVRSLKTVIETEVLDGSEEAPADDEKIGEQNEETWGLMDRANFVHWKED